MTDPEGRTGPSGGPPGARAARSGRAARTRRPRPPRGAQESLLSVVLILEAVMFFFPMLAVFGKHEVPAVVAFGGGLGFMVVLAVASRMTGNRAGVGFGWVLQAAILATGLVERFMFVVGVLFLAMWIYCYVKGGQLDRANAAARAEWEAQNPRL